MKRNKKFEAKYDLPFALIADPAHKIIDKYGVWVRNNCTAENTYIHRTSFLINEKALSKDHIKAKK